MKTTFTYPFQRLLQMCLLFIAICFGVQRVQAQSCFVQLGDATGLDLSEYEDELEAAACALIDAFPEEYQDSFKVFDFGFYLHHNTYQGGVPQKIQEMKQEASGMSPYFLLFGRQLSESNKTSKLWIEVKLPENFSTCDNREGYIRNILNAKINPPIDPIDFVQSRIKAMQLIETFRICEICDNGIDDDGDGFVDCDDLDCIEQDLSDFNGQNNRRSLNCQNLTTEQIDCILEHYEYMNQIGIYDIESALSFCEELYQLLNETFDEPNEISNGILIDDIVLDHFDDVERKPTAYTPYRHPHYPPNNRADDMKFGTDGDVKVISDRNKEMLDWSNDSLEQKMEALFHFATNSQYRPIADKFLERFNSKTGKTYDDSDLINLLQHTYELRNKVKQFGKILGEELKKVNYDKTKVRQIVLLPELRPIFSRANGYLFIGPTILINDTEQINYYLKSCEIDIVENKWKAYLDVEIIDHFGLDDDDPTNKIKITGISMQYQFLHSGFAAWWILQHRRAYVPFITKIKFRAEISGSL
jgi:hypothetical protein